jgi:hypothetical protein
LSLPVLGRPELAKRLGCTVENVNQFFSREGGMRLDTIEKIEPSGPTT